MATISMPSLNFALRVVIVLIVVGLLLRFIPQLAPIRQYML